MWDFAVLNAAIEGLGPSIQNPQGRMHRSLDRRIDHAMAAWVSKYGELNPQQERYAAAVLTGCIRSAVADGVGHPLPLVLWRIDQSVNHEVTHMGFLKRRVAPVVSDAYLFELAAA